MRQVSLLSEAVRNIRSGTSRAVSLVVVLILVGAVAGAFDGLVVSAIVKEANDYRRAGSSTYLAAAEGQVFGSTCERRGEETNIEAAGAMRAGKGDLSFATLPNLQTRQFQITPGLAELLLSGDAEHVVPRSVTPGVTLVDQNLAATLGLSVGEVTMTSLGPLQVAAMFPSPDDGRSTVLAGAVLTVVDTEDRFDECWVRYWPEPEVPSVDVLTSVSAVYSDATTKQLNAVHGGPFTGPAKFASRPSMWAPIAAAVLGGLFAFAVAVRRKLEFAQLAHLGVRWHERVTITVLESWFWAVPAAVAGAAVASLVATAGDELPDPQLLVFTSLSPVVTALAATVVVASVAATTTEGRLWREFQRR